MMINKITDSEVLKVAKLANIPLKNEEVHHLAEELSDTLEFIEKIKKLDTEGIKPTNHVTGLQNISREDEIRPSLSQKDALSGSSSIYKGYFKVGAVQED